MPIIVSTDRITGRIVIERTCDIPDCGVEVLGLFRCNCDYNEHVYCEEHACSCSDRWPS